MSALSLELSVNDTVKIGGVYLSKNEDNLWVVIGKKDFDHIIAAGYWRCSQVDILETGISVTINAKNSGKKVLNFNSLMSIHEHRFRDIDECTLVYTLSNEQIIQILSTFLCNSGINLYGTYGSTITDSQGRVDTSKIQDDGKKTHSETQQKTVETEKPAPSKSEETVKPKSTVGKYEVKPKKKYEGTTRGITDASFRQKRETEYGDGSFEDNTAELHLHTTGVDTSSSSFGSSVNAEDVQDFTGYNPSKSTDSEGREAPLKRRRTVSYSVKTGTGGKTSKSDGESSTKTESTGATEQKVRHTKNDNIDKVLVDKLLREGQLSYSVIAQHGGCSYAYVAKRAKDIGVATKKSQMSVIGRMIEKKEGFRETFEKLCLDSTKSYSQVASEIAVTPIMVKNYVEGNNIKWEGPTS